MKESLLKRSFDFEDSFIKVTNEDKAIITHAIRSLLFHNHQTCMKKENGSFDVTIGMYGDVEISRLFGIFIDKILILGRLLSFRI